MAETGGKLIGRDTDHLIEGGIYSVLANQDGRGDFVLAKIVHLSTAVVHVVIFPPSFKFRPTQADLGAAQLSFPTGIKEARARHLALERKLFSLMRPIFIREEPLTETDLAGFRQWTLLPQKEVVEAPTYIKPEGNPGVYVRIFLFCGLPFGVLQGVYHFWRDGLVAGVCAFLFGFIIFGAGMVFTQHLAVNRRARHKDGSKEDSAVAAGSTSASAFQVAEVIIDRGFGDTFSLCQEAIRTVKNCRVLQEDFSGGTVEGKVGFSLTSEGEHIVLTSYVIAPGSTGVVVASVPQAGGELDLGKNLDNVARIVSHLKMACK